eukprot:m.152827 g.152827  ORF g.152827 m.152827 type:complete len:99 (-) comp14333_c0_seq2:178-474(-)
MRRKGLARGWKRSTRLTISGATSVSASPMTSSAGSRFSAPIATLNSSSDLELNEKQRAAMLLLSILTRNCIVLSFFTKPNLTLTFTQTTQQLVFEVGP